MPSDTAASDRRGRRTARVRASASPKTDTRNHTRSVRYTSPAPAARAPKDGAAISCRSSFRRRACVRGATHCAATRACEPSHAEICATRSSLAAASACAPPAASAELAGARASEGLLGEHLARWIKVARAVTAPWLCVWLSKTCSNSLRSTLSTGALTPSAPVNTCRAAIVHSRRRCVSSCRTAPWSSGCSHTTPSAARRRS